MNPAALMARSNMFQRLSPSSRDSTCLMESLDDIPYTQGGSSAEYHPSGTYSRLAPPGASFDSGWPGAGRQGADAAAEFGSGGSDVFYSPHNLSTASQFDLPPSSGPVNFSGVDTQTGGVDDHNAATGDSWWMAAMAADDYSSLLDIDYGHLLGDWRGDKAPGPITNSRAPHLRRNDSSCCSDLSDCGTAREGHALRSAELAFAHPQHPARDHANGSRPDISHSSSMMEDSNATDEPAEFHRSRNEQLRRYREKKARRFTQPKVRYVLRKANADKRPRFKGRFIGRGEAAPAAPMAEGIV